jgi:uncharacterized protein YjaG (DUF416 family)
MPVKEINKLKKLDFQKQLVFAYLSCERFYPNYSFFSNNYNFGDPTLLRSAIDFLYDSILKNIVDKQKVENLLQATNINAPKPDDFATFYASIAMYSAGVVYESVNLLKLTDIPRILNDISTMCTDAVDLFIQERDNMDYDEDDFEAKILNDSLMQTEVSIQNGSIEYLQKIDHPNESDINTLLQLQKKGTGNLIIAQ